MKDRIEARRGHAPAVERRHRPRPTWGPLATPAIRILRDGTPVVLRPIWTRDRRRLQGALEALSEASRYARFFAQLRRFSDAQLTYLTQVDQRRHVAWIAVDPALGDRAVGVGRFIRLADEPDVAEMALTVVDAYQERWLGTELLGLLYQRARAVDIATLRAFVAPTSVRFIERLRRLDGATRFQDGLVRVDVPVHADVARMARNPYADRIRRLVRFYDVAFAPPARHPMA